MKKHSKSLSGIITFFCIFLVFFIAIFWVYAEQKGESGVKMRKAAVAGMFYENNPEILNKEIKEYLKKATPEKVQGDVIALISPHAGYTFSGQAAAFGYKLLDGKKIKKVIVIAPSHSVGFRGASIPDTDSYETPLGLVTLDRKSCDILLERKLFSSIARAHSHEHSIEVQLPFLQVVLESNFKLVPIVVGQLMESDYPVVAGSISEIISEGDLVVASSDFIHQGPRFGYVPYKTNIKENIKKLDMGAVDLILEKDTAKFIDYVEDTGATICGRCPIGILLEMLPEDAKGTLLTYYTSGDILGGETETVSYVSLAFSSVKGWLNKPVKKTLSKDRSGDKNEYLTVEDKKFLTNLARKTVEQCVKGEKITGVGLADELSPVLKKKAGVFVTLHKTGRLRGCIGYIEPVKPLYKAVIDMAVNSATRDTRFSPVSEAELKDIDIEISVLTPPEMVAGPDEFIPGEHGIIIKKEMYQAVFLPQVAPEQGWGREETLSHLCVKAGLPGDAWKNPGMDFYIFKGIVFSEQSLK